jgi:integrase
MEQSSRTSFIGYSTTRDSPNADSTTFGTHARLCCWLNMCLRRVVMEVLGHSQIALTMNNYAHVIPELRPDAAQRMEELINDR